MEEVSRPIQAPAMIRSARPPRALPSPDNALYDHACDLVQAADAIRRGATDALATPAIPAVLGCIEAALHELSGVCDAIEQTNGQVSAVTIDPGRQAAANRMARGLVNLRVALADAQAASQAARALAARRFASAGSDRVPDTR